MAWNDVPEEVRAAAEAVCTDKELEALKLAAAGYGQKRLAMTLGISRSSLRDRLMNAERKILNRLEGKDASEPQLRRPAR